MIIFPDIEPELVELLSDYFEDVRVGTRKLPADQQPESQIVVTVAYANEKTVSPVLRYAGVVLDIFASDYATASGLALEATAVLQTATGENIKQVSIVSGPTRMGDDTGQEHRAVSAEVVVKATDLNP